MGDKPKCIKFKIFASALGIISGASIFVAFIPYHNIHACIWGLLSAIFAAVNLRLHICFRKNLLHQKFTPQSLEIVKWCGIITSIATFVAAITYFILAAVLKQGYKLEDDGYAPAAIFSLLALKWTIMMFFSGRTYGKFLTNYSLIEEGCITNEDSSAPYNAIE